MNKSAFTYDFFAPMFKKFFGTMETNEVWRVQRKACAPMLYKQKLSTMGDVYKSHLGNACKRWQAEISDKGEARINIADEFESILGHTIEHIAFGEDIEHEKFDFLVYDLQTDSFREDKLTMRVAMHNMTKQTFQTFFKKMSHPIAGPLNLLFGIDMEIGSFYRNVRENSRRMHAHLNKYLQDRKLGLTKSKMDGNDLLSVFLED